MRNVKKLPSHGWVSKTPLSRIKQWHEMRRRWDNRDESVGVGSGGWWMMGFGVGAGEEPDKGVLIIFGTRTQSYWFSVGKWIAVCVKRCFPPQRYGTLLFVPLWNLYPHVLCIYRYFYSGLLLCNKTEQILFSSETQQAPPGGAGGSGAGVGRCLEGKARFSGVVHTAERGVKVEPTLKKIKNPHRSHLGAKPK